MVPEQRVGNAPASLNHTRRGHHEQLGSSRGRAVEHHHDSTPYTPPSRGWHPRCSAARLSPAPRSPPPAAAAAAAHPAPCCSSDHRALLTPRDARQPLRSSRRRPPTERNRGCRISATTR